MRQDSDETWRICTQYRTACCRCDHRSEDIRRSFLSQLQKIPKLWVHSRLEGSVLKILGLLKIDFLDWTLSIIDDALENIVKVHGEENESNSGWNSSMTKNAPALSTRPYSGPFSVRKWWNARSPLQLKTSNIEDIIAIELSCSDRGLWSISMNLFLSKHGKTAVPYPHEWLHWTASNLPMGSCWYQETDHAGSSTNYGGTAVSGRSGYPPGGRRWKRGWEMDKRSANFCSSAAMKNPISQEKAPEMARCHGSNLLHNGFNRSHAQQPTPSSLFRQVISNAIGSRAEFMAASTHQPTIRMTSATCANIYLKATLMKVEVLGPDINEKRHGFHH